MGLGSPGAGGPSFLPEPEATAEQVTCPCLGKPRRSSQLRAGGLGPRAGFWDPVPHVRGAEGAAVQEDPRTPGTGTEVVLIRAER